MPPPLIGVVEEGQSNAAMLASPLSMESVCQNAELKEHNYMGFPDGSSVDSFSDSALSSDRRSSLNIKATELRLGLPGSPSPERDANLAPVNSKHLDEKPLFPLHPSKNGCYPSQKALCSGNKRGFSDAMNGLSEDKFLPSGDVNVVLSPRPSSHMGLKGGAVLENLGTQTNKAKETMSLQGSKEKTCAGKEVHTGNSTGNNKSRTLAPKVQVVGWPPIRSFRKNSLATTSKNAEEVDGKAGSVAFFVKVSMDGAPYLRKVDLRNYAAYQELSSALEKMFSCFIAGQYGSHGNGKEMLTESKLKDPLDGSEYVLTYEDKDGDWMLVGDVPWEMFIETCKRLRVMKSSDAIGLAPRAGEKNKSKV